MTENERRMMTALVSAIDVIMDMQERGAGMTDWMHASIAWDRDVSELRAAVSREWQELEKVSGE